MSEKNNNDRNVTCAVLYRYDGEFLICHATLSSWWSIPKGLKNDGETLAEAAVRELREETGIVLKPTDLDLKGVFSYKKDKDLALFEYRARKPLNTEFLICTSFFTDATSGKQLPEVDRFKMVNLKEGKQKLNRGLYKIVRKFMRLSNAS